MRAEYNIGPRKAIEINGRKRVPDGVTETVLTEVENVKRLSFTKQLKDYLAIAQERGLRFDLFVRRDTRMSKQLKEALKKKLIHLRYIP